MGKSIIDLLSVTTVGLDLAKHVFQVASLLHAAIQPRVQRIGRLEQPPGQDRREAREGPPGAVVGVVRLTGEAR
jgi:hypothetical protein